MATTTTSETTTSKTPPGHSSGTLSTTDHHLRAHRGLRRSLLTLAVLLLLLGAIRLVLDPIATSVARKKLAGLPGYEGTFSTLHIAVFPPGIVVHNFKLIEEGARGRWDEPLLFVERAQVGILWRKLWHRQLVGRVLLQSPKVTALRQHEEKAKQSGEVESQLQDTLPLKLDRFEIVNGEALIAEGAGKNAPQLWVHGLDLLAENMATRESMMEGNRATLNLTGRIQKSGVLSAEAKVDPWTRKPTFTASGKLEKLDVRELYGFLASKTDMHADRGTVNLYVKLEAKNGALKGGVKPLLENVKLVPNDGDLGKRMKTFFADKAIDLLSDDAPAGKQVATVIPIRGSLDNPDAQLVPTVLGVIRNAFVIGLGAGFTQLPPPTAPKQEGVLKQVWHALKKDHGPPPAQPEPAAK